MPIMPIYKKEKRKKILNLIKKKNVEYHGTYSVKMPNGSIVWWNGPRFDEMCNVECQNDVKIKCLDTFMVIQTSIWSRL